jgi:quercetin dioxygenase-like cupin family protein
MPQTTPPKQSQWIKTAPGVRWRTIAVGEKLFQMLVEFEAGASTASHSHPHEQVIHVLRGKLRLILEDGAIELSPGESYVLRSNVPHGAEAPVAALLLDSFSPPRDDLIALDSERIPSSP